MRNKFKLLMLLFALTIATNSCKTPEQKQDSSTNVLTKSFTSADLQNRLIERRAVDAIIWGVPVVSLDLMRQAYLQNTKGVYNTLIWWPKGSGWKNQSLATNTIVRYIYSFHNTSLEGPVVYELPPSVEGAGFYGTIMDAWQVPLTDIGPGGKGGKYLILPPDFKGNIPAGYTPLHAKTFNTYTLLRSILKSESPEDVTKGDELVNKIKIYPLSKANNQPVQQFIDMTDVLYDPVVRYDTGFYSSLARMINEEPVYPEDMQMLGMLLPLGIEKGKEFNPDAETSTLLNSAAAEAHAWLLDGITRVPTPFWEGEKWVMPSAPSGKETTFRWELPNYFDVDGRGITLADWFGPVTVLGKSSAYLATYFDNKGLPLQGSNNYQLHVPANVPVSEFWSVTTYNMETSALFLNSPKLAVSSMGSNLIKNTDGSVDVYFGPEAPAGKEANWVFTQKETNWFPWFRFYGPQEGLYTKSWKMPDISETK
jgi:hypothetical protein